MLKAFVYCGGHPAVFDLPHSQLEVSDYLLSAEFWNPYADLILKGEDSPGSVQVRLVAKTSIDNWLQSLFSDDARLSTINTVCNAGKCYRPVREISRVGLFVCQKSAVLFRPHRHPGTHHLKHH